MNNVKSIAGKVGKPPGILEYIGDYHSVNSIAHFRSYDSKNFDEKINISVDEIKLQDERVNWIQFGGLADIESVNKLTSLVATHQMIVEDILNTNHLPKYDASDSYILVMLKAFVKNNEGRLDKNSVCVILGKDLVLDFHDYPHEFLAAKIERIKQGKGRARSKKADYLFYVILDAYIDTYYLKFDEIRENILELEDTLLEEYQQNKIEDIYRLKNELSEVRKLIFPLKEALAQLSDDEPDLIEEDNLVFMRDLKDHMNQFTEYYITYNEMIKSLIDLNNSNLNNNINQVMKVLTIIATIFIPLTFIAGIYGMNFEIMPELRYEYGYFVTIAVMIIVGITMLIFMKKKKWF